MTSGTAVPQPPPAGSGKPASGTSQPTSGTSQPAPGTSKPAPGAGQPSAGPDRRRSATATRPGGVGSRVRFLASAGAGFVGRRRELAALRSDIGRAGLDTIAGRTVPRGRVLLIAGRPGSGRTALAEELVQRLRGDYPDGLLRIRLTTSGGEPVLPTRAARQLLDAIGATAHPGADEEELSERLRTAFAGKRAILLFDDADSAEQVDPLLPHAPDCLVVAVSRGPLTGIPDVRPCTLGGLDSDAALDMLVQYAGPTRITCDPVAAESLVEECGGQPAALALVGGWLAARPQASVADVAKRLREQQPGPGAHEYTGRSLARAFRLAYESLPGPAARILRLLALAPDATADALSASALAGCSVSAAQATLEEFVAHGLLRRLPAPARTGQPQPAGGGTAPPDPEPGPEAARPDAAGGDAPRPEGARSQTAGADAAGGDPRRAGSSAVPGAAAEPSAYPVAGPAPGALRAPGASTGHRYQLPGCLEPLMHTVLREQERRTEVDLARARMLERTVRQLHACRLAAETADPEARGKLDTMPRALRFPSPAAAREWLDERLGELHEAARLAVEDGGLDTLARRLVAALTQALVVHRGAAGAAPELYELHQLVLDVAERGGLALEEAAALLNLGDLDARAGRTTEALARYKGALEAARMAGDPYATGRSLESIGSTYQELRDWNRAADWYGRALAQYLTRRDLAAEARLYARLGAVHTYAGRWGEALRGWRAAAAACRRLGDLTGHARALSETARVQEYAGRPREALRTCLEAVESARRAGDLRLQAAVRMRTADTLERLGEGGAAELHRKAAERLLARASGGEAEDPEDAPEPTYEISSSSAKD